MVRLTRAETQLRNRVKVLAAARDGVHRARLPRAKIDSIAERAELTRGAVYSNFPGKRALYFAVLADHAERAVDDPTRPGSTARRRSARSPEPGSPGSRWPPTTSTARAARHGPDARGPVRRANPAAVRAADEARRDPARARAGTAAPDAARPARTRRRDRPHGAARGGPAAAAAPGFGEPFDVVDGLRAAGRSGPRTTGGRLPTSPTSRRRDPPTSLVAAARGGRVERRARPAGRRRCGRRSSACTGWSAVEEAVRAAPPGADVTAVVVSGDPDGAGAARPTRPRRPAPLPARRPFRRPPGHACRWCSTSPAPSRLPRASPPSATPPRPRSASPRAASRPAPTATAPATPPHQRDPTGRSPPHRSAPGGRPRSPSRRPVLASLPGPLRLLLRARWEPRYRRTLLTGL